MIKYPYKDKEYTLEFNRKTAIAVEDAGINILNIEAVGDMPMRAISTLAFYAFEMHHPELTEEERFAIWKDEPCKEELTKAIIEELAKAANTLMANEEGNEKNAPKWKVQ